MVSHYRSNETSSFPTPLEFLRVAFTNRVLIARLTRREIEARYKGSLLGIFWLVLTPLLMLAIYTFVFSVVFQSRWGESTDSKGEFALFLFSGLIIFNLVSECLNRAPGLMLENISYIKKVVFPLEVQAWVALAVALFNAFVSTIILFAFYLVVRGLPPPTALLFPFVVLPLCIVVLGIIWFLSSLGVFLRDLKPILIVVTTVLMFLCPIFYPVSAVPEGFRRVLFLNPLTVVLEDSKLVLFYGKLPEVFPLLVYLLVAWIIAWFGYSWFMRSKKGFADVV